MSWWHGNFAMRSCSRLRAMCLTPRHQNWFCGLCARLVPGLRGGGMVDELAKPCVLSRRARHCRVGRHSRRRESDERMVPGEGALGGYRLVQHRIVHWRAACTSSGCMGVDARAMAMGV